jgi:hypothetical protein
MPSRANFLLACLLLWLTVCSRRWRLYMLQNLCQTMHCYISEDSTLHSHHYEVLISHFNGPSVECNIKCGFMCEIKRVLNFKISSTSWVYTHYYGQHWSSAGVSEIADETAVLLSIS